MNTDFSDINLPPVKVGLDLDSVLKAGAVALIIVVLILIMIRKLK